MKNRHSSFLITMSTWIYSGCGSEATSGGILDSIYFGLMYPAIQVAIWLSGNPHDLKFLPYSIVVEAVLVLALIAKTTRTLIGKRKSKKG